MQNTTVTHFVNKSTVQVGIAQGHNRKNLEPF